MSDTWSSIQAHKKQLDSLRERLQRRRKQDPLGSSISTPGGVVGVSTTPSTDEGGPELTPDPALERRLLLHLADVALTLPTDAGAIRGAIDTPETPATHNMVESLLQKFAAQELIEVRRGLLAEGPTIVTYADHSKLAAMTGSERGRDMEAEVGGRKRRAEQEMCGGVGGNGQEVGKEVVKKWRKQASDVSQEILELLNTTTAKEQSIVEKFRSRGRAQVQEFCDHGTKEECIKATGADRPCRKLHFR
uniref:Methyltransferase 3, N6-adenosine-methyltransferase complex catalytic subunit n=1 Tax=Coturnix japonica TaxID=93934 RepID=A0A8C2SPM1_COTJA